MILEVISNFTQETHYAGKKANHHQAVITDYYSLIAFDERVTFWLQRAGSLPCACVFAALYAYAIA